MWIRRCNARYGCTYSRNETRAAELKQLADSRGEGGLGAAISGRLASVRAFFVSMYDEFEDEGLLWFLFSMLGFCVCSLSCCGYQCAVLVREYSAE